MVEPIGPPPAYAPEYVKQKYRERMLREAATRAEAEAEAEKARQEAREVAAVREAARKAREARAAKARAKAEREAKAREKAEKEAKVVAEKKRKAEEATEKARREAAAAEVAAVRAAARAAREIRVKEKAKAEAVAVAKRKAADKAEKARVEAERAEAKVPPPPEAPPPPPPPPVLLPEEEKALARLEPFKVEEGYNLVAAVKAKVSDKHLTLLFGAEAVKQAKHQIKTLATLKAYQVTPEISRELMYEELKRGVPIAETKKKLVEMAGYNILQYLMDNPTAQAEQTLFEAGFSKEDIRQVLLPPEIIAKPKDTRKFSEKVLDRVALTTIGLWESLTPWEEKKGEGFVDWVKGTPKRLISPDIPSQAELKATYKSEQASPLWARLLFSDTVVYDKKNDQYMPVYLAVVPEKKAGAVKVAGKLVKTLSPRETGMSESQFARFLKFRVDELVKTAKPQINWNNIVRDINLGKIKSAADAVRAAAAQARWFPKRPSTVPSKAYQAMIRVWTAQGLKDAVAAASNARQYFAVAGLKVVLVPSTGTPATWRPFKPSELTPARMKELTAQWLAMKPSAAIYQINNANLITAAIAYDSVAVSKILTKATPAELHRTISRLQPAILKAVRADNLTKAQQLAKVQLGFVHLKTISTAKAVEAATKAAAKAMTEALAKGATLAEAKTATKTAAETAVETFTETITETDTATEAATKAEAKALAEGATLAEAKTAAKTAAETATQTETETQVAVQLATQTITQTATETATRNLLQTSTETAKPVLATIISPITLTPTKIKPVPVGFIPLPLPEEEEEARRKLEEYPAGTIVWKQGIWWKIIPPPYILLKPISSKFPPLGVTKIVGTPQETLTFLEGKIPFKDVSFDLGIVDGYIGVKDKTIHFTGEGLKTDIGKRLPSPTKGLSIPAEESVEPQIVMPETEEVEEREEEEAEEEVELVVPEAELTEEAMEDIFGVSEADVMGEAPRRVKPKRRLRRANKRYLPPGSIISPR